MKEITTLDDLNQALDASAQQPVFLFKHSTACPISSGARDKVTEFISRRRAENLPPFFMVKVIEARTISNRIADDLGIRHQSPQLILIKDRKAVWSASHYGINPETIGDALNEHVDSSAA